MTFAWVGVVMYVVHELVGLSVHKHIMLVGGTGVTFVLNRTISGGAGWSRSV